MTYGFDCIPLWDEPYCQPAMGAYKYVTRIWKDRYPPLTRIFSHDDYADIMSACFEGAWRVWNTTHDIDKAFIAARRAAWNEVYFLLKPYRRKNEVEQKLEQLKQKKLERLPILNLARFLFAKLSKKGKRGVRSAVLKAYILQQKTVGESFRRIETSLSSKGKWKTSFDNVRMHYRSATALIYELNRGNIQRFNHNFSTRIA